jgi:hypothetical protein
LTQYLNGRSEKDMRRSRIVRLAQNLKACLKLHEG